MSYRISERNNESQLGLNNEKNDPNTEFEYSEEKKKEKAKEGEIPSLLQLFFKLKLKIFSRRWLNKTKSRMFSNMTARQYEYLSDASSFYRGNMKRNVDCNEDDDNGQTGFCLLRFKNAFLRLKIIQDMSQIAKSVKVFDPSSKWKLIWDFAIVPLSLIYAIIIPLSLSFSLSLSYFSSYGLTYVSSLLFIIDIIVNMNTGYFEKGQLQLNRSVSIKKYLKHNLLLDFLSALFFLVRVIKNEGPYQFGDEQKSLSDIKTRDYFLLFFVLRLSSFSRTLRKIEESTFIARKKKNMITLMKLIFTIVIIAHLLSCLWIKIAKIEEDLGGYSWLLKRNIDKEEWYIQYIESYYFNTVTMVTVGYGDIYPVTPAEQVVSILIMIVSCGVFAYSVNTIGVIFTDLASEEQQAQADMQIINFYMSKRAISAGTKCKVREYLDYYWREQNEGNHQAEQKIFNQLSESLQTALTMESNQIIFQKSFLFKANFSEQLLKKIIPLIQEVRFSPGQIVFEEDDIDSGNIYFVQKGSVEIYFQTEFFARSRSQQGLQVIQKGESFGEIGFFTNFPRTMSVKSREFTTLLKINRTDFLHILKGFDKDYESFCTVRDSLALYQNYEPLFLSCFSCGSISHLLNACPSLHESPSTDKIISKHLRKVDQQRSFVSRRFRLRFSFQKCEDKAFQTQIDNQEYLKLISFQIEEQADNKDEQQGELEDAFNAGNFGRLDTGLGLQRLVSQDLNSITNNKKHHTLYSQGNQTSSFFHSDPNEIKEYEESFRNEGSIQQTQDGFLESTQKSIKNNKINTVGQKKSNNMADMSTISEEIFYVPNRRNSTDSRNGLMPKKGTSSFSNAIARRQGNVKKLPFSVLDKSIVRSPKVQSQQLQRQLIMSQKKSPIQLEEIGLLDISCLKEEKQLLADQLNKIVTLKQALMLEKLNEELEHKEDKDMKRITNSDRDCKREESKESREFLMKRILAEESVVRENMLKLSTVAVEFEPFDVQKNYMIYFPYNNLSYLLQIQEQIKKHSNFTGTNSFKRIELLNRNHLRLRFKHQLQKQLKTKISIGSPNSKAQPSSTFDKKKVQKISQMKRESCRQTSNPQLIVEEYRVEQKEQKEKINLSRNIKIARIEEEMEVSCLSRPPPTLFSRTSKQTLNNNGNNNNNQDNISNPLTQDNNYSNLPSPLKQLPQIDSNVENGIYKKQSPYPSKTSIPQQLQASSLSQSSPSLSLKEMDYPTLPPIQTNFVPNMKIISFQ